MHPTGFAGALTLLATAAALPAQSEARALALFRRAFSGDTPTAKSVDAKRAALAGLRGHDSAKVARALVDAFVALESEAEPIRQRRRSLLMRGGGSKLMQPQRAKLQPVRDLQEGLLAAVAGQNGRDAVRRLILALVGSKARLPLSLEIALARRAADLEAGDLALLLDASRAPGKRANARHAGLALPLLAALRHAGRRAADAAPFAITQLHHALVDVRVAAAATLASICSPDAIRPLVARLEAEEGRAREAMFDALTGLTGEDPGRSATAWRAWLAGEGAAFSRGEKALGRKPSGRPSRKPRRRDRAPASRTATGSYFGLPQDGDSILYVFDNSNSMHAPMPGQRLRPPAQQVTRMDRCRKELHRALDALTPRKRFNLLAFANRLRLFAPKMQAATKSNLAKAHAWIDGLRLEFQTNIHDALELSFCIAGRGVEDRYYPLEADTIFFLSDGAPTTPNASGKGIHRDDIPQILAAVRRWNPLRRMVIHTIGIGRGLGDRRRRGNGRGRGKNGGRRKDVQDFMRRLAEENGGRFVVAR